MATAGHLIQISMTATLLNGTILMKMDLEITGIIQIGLNQEHLEFTLKELLNQIDALMNIHLIFIQNTKDV